MKHHFVVSMASTTKRTGSFSEEEEQLLVSLVAHNKNGSTLQKVQKSLYLAGIFYFLLVCDLGGLPLAPPYWRIGVENHISAIISLSVRDTSI
jgi:hypothetical protein